MVRFPTIQTETCFIYGSFILFIRQVYQQPFLSNRVPRGVNPFEGRASAYGNEGTGRCNNAPYVLQPYHREQQSQSPCLMQMVYDNWYSVFAYRLLSV